MLNTIVSSILAVSILISNININNYVPTNYESRLICVSNFTKYFSFGFNTQVADTFWMRFLQELDAYNQLVVAEAHLCPDKTSSWHFHIINIAIDLDSKFYEIMLHAPLLISVTISDSKGASILFNKAVENFPNDWRILYRAAYQAQLEEHDIKKAAGLLYRAGKNGAPRWVMSLAGGLYNETGNRMLAEQIYSELLKEAKDESTAIRLRAKLDNKRKNFFKQEASESPEFKHGGGDQ